MCYICYIELIFRGRMLSDFGRGPFSNCYSAPISFIDVLFTICALPARARTLALLKKVDQEQRHGFRWYPFNLPSVMSLALAW